MFYEKISDCQLTNKQIAKHLKYINNKKENDVQYLKIKKMLYIKMRQKNKDINEYGIERNKKNQ